MPSTSTSLKMEKIRSSYIFINIGNLVPLVSNRVLRNHGNEPNYSGLSLLAVLTMILMYKKSYTFIGFLLDLLFSKSFGVVVVFCKWCL